MIQSSIYSDPTNSTQHYTFYQPFYHTNTWVTSLFLSHILINYTQLPLQAREGYVDKNIIEEHQLSGVSPYAVIQCKNGVEPGSRCHMMPL